MVLLDTHIWLWWLLGDGSLSSEERKALHVLASDGKLAISWVSVWETELLERKGRVSLFPDFQTWIEQATQPDVVTVLTADTDVVIAQRKLPEIFHTDPADRLIAATSILSGFPLATHDRKIIESGECEIWNP
jgi:PIN domain nuclease of toxin-antitoxin system